MSIESNNPNFTTTLIHSDCLNSMYVGLSNSIINKLLHLFQNFAVEIMFKAVKQRFPDLPTK